MSAFNKMVFVTQKNNNRNYVVVWSDSFRNPCTHKPVLSGGFKHSQRQEHVVGRTGAVVSFLGLWTEESLVAAEISTVPVVMIKIGSR